MLSTKSIKGCGQLFLQRYHHHKIDIATSKDCHTPEQTKTNLVSSSLHRDISRCSLIS